MLVWDGLKGRRLQLCPPTDGVQQDVGGRAATMTAVVTAEMCRSLCAARGSWQL